MVSAEFPLTKWDADAIKKAKPLIIEGDKWRAYSGGTFTFKIDPTKNPKQLDLYVTDTGVATYPGIYKIEGDTLTICRWDVSQGARDGDGVRKRPTEFKAGKGVALLQFKRSGK
jgi:uncharacterized protein (TIGR03067 family)